MAGVPFAVRFGLDATNNRIIQVADPAEWNDPTSAKDGTPRDWILNRSNWTKLAGRVGDLPKYSSTAPIRDGQTHLIKYRFGGEELSRLAVWDSSKTQIGGVQTIQVTVPVAEIPNVKAEAALGSTYPGEVFNGGGGDAIFDLVPNADGSVTATITTAGSGYSFGETATGGPYGAINNLSFAVNSLSGASSTGGWRFVDNESWIKDTQAQVDVQTDRNEGDYQATTEVDHKELKIFHNGAWITLFSEDDIKAWIASLSLFEGTVKNENGGAVGAVEFHELPNLDGMSRTKDLSQVSHYWTFVGSPNTAVFAEYDVTGLTGGVPGLYRITIGGTKAWVRVLTATTAKVGIQTLDAAVVDGNTLTIPAGELGAGSSASTFTVPDITKLATPIVGTDLSGAVLNPGDWAQIANKGTPAAPDLHWVTIGGDLLAKARADKLFSLQQWVDGSWEKGSLVTNQGSIYRAKQAVTTGDAEPGAGAAIAQVDVVTIAAPTGAGEAYTLSVNGNAVTYTTVAGDGIAEVRQGLIDEIGKVAAFLRIATPSAGGKPEELALTATTPGTGFTTALTTTNLTSTTKVGNTAATTNSWEKVNLSGGVRWVQTDGDLPANAPPGEIYFVLASAKAGGAGRLTYWDGGAAKWQDLGGGAAGGTPLKLDGGIVVYPDVIYWDGTGTKPNGKVINDLLFHSQTNVVQRWTGTAWANLLVNVPYGTAGNKDKFVIANASGDPTWSGKTFEEAVKESAVKVFPQVSAPAEDKPSAGSTAVTSFNWRSVAPGTQHTWVFRANTSVEPVLYLAGGGTADGVKKHLYIQGQLMAGTGLFEFSRDEDQAKASYWYKGMDFGDDNNRVKSGEAYIIKTTWYDSEKNDEQYMFYEHIYRRKSDGMKSIIYGRVWLPGKTAHPVTGYAINAYTHDKIGEARVY